MTNREECGVYEIVVRGDEDGRSFWCDVVFYCDSPRRVVFAERVSGRSRLEAHLKAVNVIKATIGGGDWLDKLHSTE